MDDIEFCFDVARQVFTHEESGYTLTSSFILNNDDKRVQDEIYANIGRRIDKDLTIMLRYTAEEFAGVDK